MAVAIKTPEVLQDLDQIVEYIASDNLSAAVAWLDEIEALFHLLAGQPYIGQELHTKRLGMVRRHVVGNYLVYYRPATSGVTILHVIHSARDQERLV